MSAIVLYVLYFSLLVHIVLIAVGIYKVWRGENVIDRLIGVDLLATFTLAVLVLAAMIAGRSLYIDVALGLAVLGFVSTIAYARYIADEKVF